MAFRIEQVQRQTQRLIMSPQMQQAIHILQLPLMELSTLIQQEMVNNPVLEEATTGDETLTEKTEKEADPEVDFDKEFSRLAQLDDEWKEYYQQTGSYGRVSEDAEKKRRYYEESITDPESLQEHLLKQLYVTITNEKEKSLGETLIGNLDENGYLFVPLIELAASSNTPVEDLEKVLKMIQTFHPVGVGARDLKECLLLQLSRIGREGSLEAKIIRNHLDDLGRRNLANIAKAMNLSLLEVQKVAELISALEPKPGRIFDKESTHYATPDVFVTKVGDAYVVVLNDERTPHVRISNLYRTLVRDKSLESQTKDYIRQKIQAGKWLVKNIQLRQQTIYNIASTIVKEQQEFFEYGVTSLKPLTMQKVANEISMHESTVSRAIANKYMSTPRGLFQMKYFFTPGMQNQSGQNVSTTNIKEMVSDIIAKEDSLHPLSDQELVELLKAKGTNIARRTITKYRKELKILPSNLRKKY